MTGPADGARVIYAALPTTRRSGGVHVMMQHVALLRSAGRQAWLWLPGPDAPPSWFDPALPTLVAPTLQLGAADLLVLPEVPLVAGQDPAPGARAVILNQNHFFTHAAESAAWEAAGSAAGDAVGGAYPGWALEPAVWAVSVESCAVLRALHPQLPVTLVPNFVDADEFAPADTPLRSVAWFTRKRPRESALLHRLLAADPRLAGVRLHPITDEDRPTVVGIINSATVFVSLAHTEGFGLPVAEALAAGCLVVGYDGGGGAELFAAPGAWRVADQRPLLLVEQVAHLVQNLPGLAHRGAANREWLLERYHRERTATALEAAVDAAFGRPGAAGVARHPAHWLAALPPQFHLMG